MNALTIALAGYALLMTLIVLRPKSTPPPSNGIQIDAGGLPILPRVGERWETKQPGGKTVEIVDSGPGHVSLAINGRRIGSRSKNGFLKHYQRCN